MSYQHGLVPIIQQYENKLTKNGWQEVFTSFIPTEGFDKLNNQLILDCKNTKIYPPSTDVFNALLLTSLKDVKVVILGLDPYHTEGVANGLAFSTNGKPPPSLKNIYKEVEDNGFTVNYKSGDLTKWAEQGVLLINTALTVKQAKPGSYVDLWEPFTVLLIKQLIKHKDNLVVMLWGKQAQKYEHYFINYDILVTSHPSPHSSYIGFLGCQHFIKCNQILHKHNLQMIDWNL